MRFAAGESAELKSKGISFGTLARAADGMPYFHHGKFTTMREAIEAHAGEAAGVKANWDALASGERDAIIEFLKSLRVLPEGKKALAIGNKGKKVKWPSFPWTCGQDVNP